MFRFPPFMLRPRRSTLAGEQGEFDGHLDGIASEDGMVRMECAMRIDYGPGCRV